MLALSSGCLVTAETQFEEEPNYPTTIVAVSRSAVVVGRPFWINTDQLDEDGLPLSMWTLVVGIRDENLDDVLRAQWRVRTEDRPEPLFRSRTFQESDDPVRELEMVISSSDLELGACQLLELVAGRDETFTASDGPTNPNDFGRIAGPEPAARAAWLILEGSPAELTEEEQRQRLGDSCGATVTAMLGGATVSEGP